jgi:tRNA(Ile2) C34 agmatinyltransferase TiaS
MDEPIKVPKVETEKLHCPECRGGRLKRATVTAMAVYFRCEGCGATWSIPERRNIPRKGDETM